MTSGIRLAIALCALSLWLACGSRPSSPPPSSPASAAPAAAPEPTRAERRALHGKGMAAYDHKDYATCASLLEQARDFYSAACCYSLAGDRDHAFASLSRAIDGGWRNAGFEKDADLVPLHDDPRWSKELAHFQAKAAEHNRSLNPELTRLHDEDQADRSAPSYEQIDWSKVAPRDQARRKRVDEIVAAGGARAADDYYHAAMVYQHGDSPDEIQRRIYAVHSGVEQTDLLAIGVDQHGLAP
jgi:hypothetical protein